MVDLQGSGRWRSPLMPLHYTRGALVASGAAAWASLWTKMMVLRWLLLAVLFLLLGRTDPAGPEPPAPSVYEGQLVLHSGPKTQRKRSNLTVTVTRYSETTITLAGIEEVFSSVGQPPLRTYRLPMRTLPFNSIGVHNLGEGWTALAQPHYRNFGVQTTGVLIEVSLSVIELRESISSGSSGRRNKWTTHSCLSRVDNQPVPNKSRGPECLRPVFWPSDFACARVRFAAVYAILDTPPRRCCRLRCSDS